MTSKRAMEKKDEIKKYFEKHKTLTDEQVKYLRFYFRMTFIEIHDLLNKGSHKAIERVYQTRYKNPLNIKKCHGLTMKCFDMGYCNPEIAIFMMYHIEKKSLNQIALELGRTYLFIRASLAKYEDFWPIRGKGGPNNPNGYGMYKPSPFINYEAYDE